MWNGVEIKVNELAVIEAELGGVLDECLLEFQDMYLIQ